MPWKGMQPPGREAGSVQAMRGGGGDAAAGTQAPGLLAGHPAHFTPFASNESVDLDKVCASHECPTPG